MIKRLKIPIFLLIAVVISITAVYAVTIIRAADVIYDNSKSNGNSSNVQGAIDELYSISDGSCSGGSSTTRGTNLIDYITNLSKTDTANLAYDDTVDKNLRYIGSNPNNYVLFNDELWRIIGVMNNVKDENGNSASRVKLIRAESIGNIAWDTSNTNDWSNASLQKLLNSGDYYKRNGSYSSTGLTEASKSMISSIVWNLGGVTTAGSSSLKFYLAERENSVYAGRTAEWNGYIGLMYASDYGYAVGSESRKNCLSSTLYDYNSNNCYLNDWLYQQSSQWTLSPGLNSGARIYYINSNGSLYGNGDANLLLESSPVVYLKTNIKKIGGTGTSDDPYKISNIVTSNDESNASPPKLDEDGKLIPITLADDGKVTYTSEEDEEWYNYSDKKWANAVILTDSPSKTYKEGDMISESDIESYFVWIPKYKYRLWNTGTASKKAHEIDIVFDTTDTVDKEGVSCKTPMTSGGTGNCNNGEYMTHPAFISLGVNGFWVGKFETGYKGATSTASAQVNSNDSSKIIIKPNVYSWRSNTVYNFFTSAYNYERSLDSHMMKNTEWGAVAYLSHSRYGINREVNVNNNSAYKTGYSALPSTNQQTYPGDQGDNSSSNQPYNTEIGYLASTTGNISGVYDTSGGAHDYVAAYVSGNIGNSGFSISTLSNYDEKYFDVYDSNSSEKNVQYRILGDSTAEMGPFKSFVDGDNTIRMHNSWYSDFSFFIGANHSWFYRGGKCYNGILASPFSFLRNTGESTSEATSRIVLIG